MAGHLLGDLELAAVLKVGGDPGGAEAVGADLGAQSCSSCPALDHHVHIGLGQGCPISQPAMAQGREERGLSLPVSVSLVAARARSEYCSAGLSKASS